MMAKHKKGDRFILEIAEVHTHFTDKGKPYSCYRVKGFNTVMFDDYGLERFIFLEDKNEELIEEDINQFIEQGVTFSNKILTGEDYD